MTDAVDRMLLQLDASTQRPPVHLWQPSLSGTLDMRIAADGDWYYQGGKIARPALVRLFASILRIDPELGHVLVTPTEKWLVEVDDVAFVAVAIALAEDRVRLVTNVGDELLAGPEHPISVRLDQHGTAIPYIDVHRGLQARLSRPVYYELAEHAEIRGGVTGISSLGQFYPLQ